MQAMLSVHGVISREKEDDLERRFKLLNHELRNCLSIEGRHRHALHSLHCCWMMKLTYSDGNDDDDDDDDDDLQIYFPLSGHNFRVGGC